MKKPIIIVGVGEMGSVFARGFLKAGYSVIPVNRHDDLQLVSEQTPEPELVLIAVAEKELPAVLDQLPASWIQQIVLLQNELLPDDWRQKGLQNPTVISVWFEKKPGMDFKVLIPSPVNGSKAQVIQQALGTLNIPVQIINSASDMLFELVRKNMYILTTNICGLQTGGNVHQLWQDNSILMNRVFDDVLLIQEHLSAESFDRDHLLNAVLSAFEGDPLHQCMGRSAPARLQRALEVAQLAGLETPALQNLAASLN